MPDPKFDPRVDATLVSRALNQQDQAAFGQLVHRHQGMVRAQLRRLARGDHGWADDMAQETFLQAWRHLHQFRGDARFSTWLHRIAYTTFLQATRSRKIGPPHGTLEEIVPHDDSLAQALRLDVLNAMESLPPGERLALLHCYHLDLSHEEAAFVLGIPVGTVKTNVARGKARLKERLAAWNLADGDEHE